VRGGGSDDDQALAPTGIASEDVIGATNTLPGAEGERTQREAPTPFKRGARLDHFIVLGKLGAGGEPAKQRLLREAQALAEPSLASVVSVFEVGTIDRELFVAMEYVDGTTLAQRLDDGDRRWCEITVAFAAAGEGLSAMMPGCGSVDAWG